MALRNCKECGKEISSKASSCPHCGAPAKQPPRQYGCFSMIIIIIVGIYLLSSYSDFTSRKEAVKKDQRVAQQHASAAEQFNQEIEKHYQDLLANRESPAKAVPMVTQFERFNRLDYKEVASIRKEVLIAEYERKVRPLPATDIQGNLDLYRKLQALAPENQEYRKKVSHYQQAIDRQKTIENQFSSWDGSHRNFEREIKRNMHNPKSYKHVETRYWDKGDHLIVRTTYRGTNAFGAVVTNTAQSKVDLDGNVLIIYPAAAF